MTKVLAEVTGSISFSQRGDKGQKGALMREHDGFESGSYKYLSGAGEEAYIDVVCVKGKWYQCTKTYDNATSSPSLTDGHWTEMSNYKSIATHLLLAENATINMLGTNQINLYNPTTSDEMYGSFRVVNNDNDYSLWLGASSGDSAPFSVKRNGKAKMTDADITGNVIATSGQVGGLKIEGDSLTNEGFNNDAYIVLRNDINKVFAGIGGNVLPVSAGDMQAVARFTIENTSDSFIGINYALICGAKGKATNVALDMTLGGYVTGLRIKNTYIATGGSIYSQAVDIPKNVHSVILAGSGYYKMPQMEKEDDGYIIFIKRAADRGAVHLLSGYARDSKDGLHTSAFYYDRGDGTTDLEIKSIGDAMIFVYHREMVYNDTYQGCWIQYKCPRDW